MTIIGARIKTIGARLQQTPLQKRMRPPHFGCTSTNANRLQAMTPLGANRLRASPGMRSLRRSPLLGVRLRARSGQNFLSAEGPQGTAGWQGRARSQPAQTYLKINFPHSRTSTLSPETSASRRRATGRTDRQAPRTRWKLPLFFHAARAATRNGDADSKRASPRPRGSPHSGLAERPVSAAVPAQVQRRLRR